MYEPPMTADLVFGRGRLQMPTGEHVEVYREAARPGERLRYSKRFRSTLLGDFRPWTERECQILQRLAGQGGGSAAPAVAQVAGYTAAADGRDAELQTWEAGISVEHWTTLQPSHPDRPAARHVFEDCAHWWALAHHCLRVLDAIHEQGLVHLDLKADNICIPWDRARSIQPAAGELRALRFGELRLIDVAFSVFTGEVPVQPLPLDRHTRYDYQSPRLLDAVGAGRRGLMGPTRDLDWRCDFFSLAAMLWLYLPELEERSSASWTEERHAQAGVLVRRLLDEHHAEPQAQRPHQELIALTRVLLNQADLAASLRQGWTFTPRDEDQGQAWSTPPTRITGTPQPVAPAVSAKPTGTAGRTEPVAEGPAWSDAGAAPELPPRLRHRPPQRRAAQALRIGTVLAGAAALGYVWWAFEPPPMPARISPDAATRQPAPPQGADGAGGERTLAQAPSVAPRESTAGQASDAGPRESTVPPAPAEAGSTSAEAGPPAPAALPRAQADAAATSASAAGVNMAPAPGVGDPAASAPLAPLAPTAPEAPPPTVPPGNITSMDTPGSIKPAAQPPAPSTPATEAGTPAEPAAPASADADDARAHDLLTGQIPKIAAWAEQQLAPVLRSTVRTDMLPRRDELRGAIAAARLASGRPELKLAVHAQESRRLNDLARTAYWDRNNVQEAVRLQVRAFAANPLDPEVVGNLAFLRMRERPPQIRAARQLALHSLTVADSRYPLGRVQDWTTLAIANALLGRDADARHAWYISLVLAPDRQQHRNAALRAVSIYGERLRPSVDAMLRREFPPERERRSERGRSGAES